MAGVQNSSANQTVDEAVKFTATPAALLLKQMAWVFVECEAMARQN
jgi:hypothetical protein